MIFKFGDLPGGSTINKAVNTAKSVVQKTAPTVKNVVNKVADSKVPFISGPIAVGPKVTPRKIVNAAADFTVRPIARAGYEATKTIMKDNSTFTPKTSAQKALLGQEPLRNIFDPNRTSSKIASKVGIPKVGPLIAVGGAAMDITGLTPGGAGKTGVKKIASNIPEEVGAAYKFGKTLQSYAQEAKNVKFAKDLKLESDINRNLIPNLDIPSFKEIITPEGIKKLVRIAKDQSGFINFGSDIGKPKLSSEVEQGLKSTKASLNDISTNVKSNVLDKKVAKVGDTITTKPGILGEGEYKIVRKTPTGEATIRRVLEDGSLDKKAFDISASDIGEVFPTKTVTLPSLSTKLLGPGNPEARIKEALTRGGLKRTEQEAMYTKERGQRFAQLDQAFQDAGGGEKGVYAKLGKLKGEYAKVDFDPIRDQLTDNDVNSLINKIEQSAKLTRIEKVPAQQALIGLLDGKLPTESEIEKLRMVFPKDIVDSMVKNPSKMQKLTNALNLPRTLQSSLDLSAPLRQGIFPAMAHPRDFSRSFKNMFGYAFSQKKFDNFHEELTKRPTYLKMREAGMQYTDIDGALSNREEAFVSNLTEKVPVIGSLVKGSARAYTGFLNNFRADLFDNLYKNAEKMGRGNDEKLLKDIAKYINTATGRGDFQDVFGKRAGTILTESAPLLNAAFFSPRLIASRLSLMNPVYYAKLDPLVRKDALKSLVAFTGTGMSLLGLASLAGAEVGTDPRSADFGKIKIGNTRYDLWGGFQPYAVLIARLITGETKSSTTGKVYEYGKGYKPTTRKDAIQRFAEGKASPLASFGMDILKGTDFEGKPLNYKELNPTENPITQRFLPILAQDLSDTIKEYGFLGPLVSTPGIFGIGSATYKARIKPKSLKSNVL